MSHFIRVLPLLLSFTTTSAFGAPRIDFGSRADDPALGDEIVAVSKELYAKDCLGVVENPSVVYHLTSEYAMAKNFLAQVFAPPGAIKPTYEPAIRTIEYTIPLLVSTDGRELDRGELATLKGLGDFEIRQSEEVIGELNSGTESTTEAEKYNVALAETLKVSSPASCDVTWWGDSLPICETTNERKILRYLQTLSPNTEVPERYASDTVLLTHTACRIVGSNERL